MREERIGKIPSQETKVLAFSPEVIQRQGESKICVSSLLPSSWNVIFVFNNFYELKNCLEHGSFHPTSILDFYAFNYYLLLLLTGPTTLLYLLDLQRVYIDYFGVHSVEMETVKAKIEGVDSWKC